MRKFYFAAGLLLLLAVVARYLVPVAPPVADVPARPSATNEAVTDILHSIDYVLGFAPAEVPPEIVQRPLFFKERRPPSEEMPELVDKKPTEKPKAAGKPPQLALKGVVGVGGERYALVSMKGQKGTRRLKAGEEVDGWKLGEIHHDRLVLTRGAEKQEVLLRVYKPWVPARKPPKPAVKKSGKKIVGKAPARKKRISAKRGTTVRKQEKAVSSPPREP